MNTSGIHNTSSVYIRRGIRKYTPNKEKFVLLYIHDLQSWNVQKMYEFLSKRISNLSDIIHGIIKKHKPNMENYFIIRVNYSKPTYYLNIIYQVTSYLPVERINFKVIDNSHKPSSSCKINRKKYSSYDTISLASEFTFTNHRTNSQFFNLCVSWNINGWNLEKHDGMTYFNHLFRPICICLQEVGDSQFLNNSSPNNSLLRDYNSLLRKADPSNPGMRGLFIGVHSSCSFLPDPFEYKYIISVKLISFWGMTCHIGNVYIPSSKHKKARSDAINDINRWLKSNKKKPAFLVGDFNMTKKQLSSVISNSSQHWSIMDLIGHQFTWSRGGRATCIDHVIINNKLKDYINKVSVCTSFNDLSDHFPLLISCPVTSPDDFITPPPSKTVKWSSQVCRQKNNVIFSHNYFSVLVNDLDSDNSASSSVMLNKFIDTANRVGDNIKARVPADLKGSAFHCPYEVKKLSHEKHLAFMRIKRFRLDSNLNNLDEFLELNRAYMETCDYIRSIKSNLRKNRFKKSVKEACDYFSNSDPRRGWSNLKKISKPMFSSPSSPNILKDKNGNCLYTHQDILNRFGEHYENLASDVTNHSLNREYWEASLTNSEFHNITWNINDPITMKEIQETVLHMKNNKAPGPDGIPIEFFKAFFKESDSSENDQSTYSDCAKCLLILFNKIWSGDFPDEWNSASIVSIPKKGDLTDCNNYRGISLINVGLKILCKIVTNRISNYALSHNFVRPEQFGFRNKEECISLYISIREICQRRKFNTEGSAPTYLAFLDLQKAYDSVPIYNILTKLYKLGIRGNCHQFLTNLYLSSKARARVNGDLSNEFPIHRGVRQGCPLSPILFNLFINDVLDGCEKYGINLNGTRCCGGLFADDIVIVAPSRNAMKKILNRVYSWSIKNEMTFGINKCATMVVKPLNFIRTNNYQDPTFYLGIHTIPKTTCYTYLGIPFDESLSLDPVISNLNCKMNNTLYSYFRFLNNKNIPIPLKKLILGAYVLSNVHYFAPLLGSNKKKTSKAQSIFNRGLYWCFGFPVGNTNVSLYDMTKELHFPPISGICALAQRRCFNKFKDSACIINFLTNNIPCLNHNSWTKESRTLNKKFIDRDTLSKEKVLKFYWERDIFKPSKAKKAIIYKEQKFGYKKYIYRLSLKYPQFQLGFFWISRIRCGFKFDVRPLIRRNLVLRSCPKRCPCCYLGPPSFAHWVLNCNALNHLREKFLKFIDGFFIKVTLLVHEKSLEVSEESERDYEDNVNYLIVSSLLGGKRWYKISKMSDGERRQYIDEIFNPSNGSSVPYFIGIAEFLTHAMPFISREFSLLVDRFSVGRTEAERVDVETIRQGRTRPSNTESIDTEISDISGAIIEEWEMLEEISSSYIM